MQFSETQPLLLDISNITLRINHEEFEQLCQDNPDMRLGGRVASEPKTVILFNTLAKS
jgi:hypothetical protein